MLNRDNLHSYQKKSIEIIKKAKKFALFADMGLGKTIISLNAALDLLNNFEISKILIVAPLRVANTVWAQEAHKWDNLKDLKISVCTGPLEKRKKALETKADIYVINRELLVWLIKNFKWDFDGLIVDESSSFKNPNSQRFRYLKKVMIKVNFVILLSGTPAPNGLMDLWSQIYLLDFGERLGSKLNTFRHRFFKQTYFRYEPLKGSAEVITHLIRDICLSLASEDYLDLPEKIIVNERISLPPKAQEQYSLLEKEFLILLETGTSIEAPSAAALGNKLLQICNGAVYDENSDAHEIHDEKIKVLKEIIEDNPSENFLIAYSFRSDLIRLKKSLPDAIILSRSGQEVDDWNKGKIKILLTHPASAGHGLNLQYGGSVIIWFGLNWSLELYQQFNKRIHRQGQTKPTRIVHIMAKGTIEERVLYSLEEIKAKTQKEFLDGIKYFENK